MSTRGDKNAAVDSSLEELLQILELMRPPMPKRKPTKSLLGAVYDNNTELVKTFLAAGSSPNQSNKYGSVIGRAVSRGNPEILDLLIAAGVKNPGGHLPSAAERGDLAIVKRLFEAGVDLEKDGGPALSKAAYHNRVEVVKLLLEKGVSVAFNNYHAVGEAARNGSFDALKILFAAGVRPEHAGDALRMAASAPLAFACVKFLVDAGVDPLNHPHYAFYYGNRKNPPFTAADAAAEANKPEVADYLRGKPIDVDALLAKEEKRRKEWNNNDDLEADIREEREKKTEHLLRGAARSEAVQRAVSLVKNPALKASLNNPGKSGETALGLAASNGDLEIVSALLEQGADPNQPKKCPPLCQAASAGHTDIVKKLLQAGVDMRDVNQGSALIEAADWDDPEMVKALLDAGADPKVQDEGGRTPMNVEHGLHGDEIKTLLRQAVQKRAGNKPEKGQGLSFLKGKGKLDLADARGVQDFRGFYDDWSVLFVRASIDDVSRVCAEVMKPVRVEKDVAKKKVSPARRFVYTLQLKDSPWSLVLYSLGSLRESDVEAVKSAAREFSKKLNTRAYTYVGEDKSGAESYELFEKGESIEKATQCGEIEFESKLRARPEFTAESFPDPVISEEGIYLPVCYPKDDGYDVKLVLERLQRGDVERADFLALEE
jgi:ankyrin repeat protein